MSVTLAKGGNVSLSKAAPNLTRVRIGLGWKARSTTGAGFDLDASALLCGAGRVLGDEYFVFAPAGGVETGWQYVFRSLIASGARLAPHRDCRPDGHSWEETPSMTDPSNSADVIRGILFNELGAPRDIAVLNAAGAMVVAERASDLREGVARVEEAIEDGRKAHDGCVAKRNPTG